MSLSSICDRIPLARLRAWRLRLQQELSEPRGFGGFADRRGLMRQYEALQLEIADQNCKRQCAEVQRFKGESPASCPRALGEMGKWWWQRY